MPAKISFVHVEPKGTEASLKVQMEGHCPHLSGLFLALLEERSGCLSYAIYDSF